MQATPRGGNTTPRRRLPAFVVEFNKAIVLLLLDAAASACLPFEISAPLISNRAQCFLGQDVDSRALADVDCVLR
jgi:hypothetical protein